MKDKLGILRVEGNGGEPLADVTENLSRLNIAYSNFCLFDRFDESKSFYAIFGFVFEEVQPTWEREASKPWEQVRLRSDDGLVLKRVQLASPGFWEFLGKINPLEVLRLYLNDRHERSKDIQYRNSIEEEREHIKLGLKKLELIEKTIEVARKANVPEEHISAVIERAAVQPLVSLTSAHNLNVFTTSKVSKHGAKDVGYEGDDVWR